MNSNKKIYNTPEARVIEVEGGSVMENLGMSDNKSATEIQSKKGHFEDNDGFE